MGAGRWLAITYSDFTAPEAEIPADSEKVREHRVPAPHLLQIESLWCVLVFLQLPQWMRREVPAQNLILTCRFTVWTCENFVFCVWIMCLSAHLCTLWKIILNDGTEQWVWYYRILNFYRKLMADCQHISLSSLWQETKQKTKKQLDLIKIKDCKRQDR